MKIYSADTWTMDELQAQAADAGRRSLVVPAADSKRAVLETFGNFERILPRQDSGYYREYTVPTPGESDRGARRIVTGAGGEKYYTQDHYDSFKFIAEGS